MVYALTPPKSIEKPPPQSGHEWQPRSALLATTVDPVRSSKYVAAAASAVLRRRLGTPAAAGSDMTAVAIRNPRMIMARPRWTRTSQGASSLATTTPPRAPSAAIATSDPVASQATSGRCWRNTIQASTTVATRSKPVKVPTDRWEYSMIEWMSAGG